MQTLRPWRSSARATHSTRGVLPVPPVVILPTLMTGASSVESFRTPRLYRAKRVRVTAAYSTLSGASTIDDAEFMRNARLPERPVHVRLHPRRAQWIELRSGD